MAMEANGEDAKQGTKIRAPFLKGAERTTTMVLSDYLKGCEKSWVK